MFKNLFSAPAAAAEKIALQTLASNIMLADADFNITFVNASLQEMLEGIESDLRRDLPQFDARRLVGANIDVFHKNPAKQRGMLARLNGRHAARIAVGGRTLGFTASALTDAQGRRLGYSVEWSDLTAQVSMEKAQAEINRVIAAASSGDLSQRADTTSLREEDCGPCVAVNKLLDQIKTLGDQMQHMAGEHQKGDIDVVIDSQSLHEPFRSLAQGINDMVGAHIAVKKLAMGVIGEFGRGNFDAPLEKLPGKKAFKIGRAHV